MEERLYYLCRVQLSGNVIFVVWHSGERNGFVRDEFGRLRAACTPEALTATAGARNVLPVNSEPIEYDFDRIRAWCAAPEVAGVDHAAFPDAWNFLDDLAGLHDGADTPYTRLSRGAAECYDKLFWGSNLPAVTPPGERFEPAWQADELIDLRRVLEAASGCSSRTYGPQVSVPDVDLSGSYVVDRDQVRRPASLVQVSQIPRRFASGPAGEIPPGESIVKRCWRPGSSAKVSLTLFG